MFFSDLPLEMLTSTGGAIFTALIVTSSMKHLWLRRARAAREQRFTLVGHVTELAVFPIKGCAAVELQSATATPNGLISDGYSDRRWMVIEEGTGKVLDLKHAPRLTHVTSKIDGDWLVVSAPDMEPLQLPLMPSPAEFPHTTAAVFGTRITALDCGAKASTWMSRYLGRDAIRLVHSRPSIGLRHMQDLNYYRGNDARPGDTAVFANHTSYLMTTTGSLSDLNSRLEKPVSSRNFRPNIIVDTKIPFDEDNWQEIQIGATARFHYVQPCQRCVVTTVDPKTGVRGNQPLAMLRAYRQVLPYNYLRVFGAEISLDRSGLVRVGDPVYAIKRQTQAT